MTDSVAAHSALPPGPFNLIRAAAALPFAATQAETAPGELLAEFDRVMDGPLEVFRTPLAEAGFTPLPLREPISGR